MTQPTVPDLGKMSDAELKEMLRASRAVLASKLDNPEGFAHFYFVVFGKEIPRHAAEWIEEIYRAREKKDNLIIRAFRGSTKTTTVTIAFLAWRIGWGPEESHLLLQVGDDIASNNSKAVADMIDMNDGFRMVFPDVVPYKEKGWGAKGYEVRRASVTTQEWASVTGDRKDPSFVGLGYGSSAIIGKHPTGLLLIDDIADENNTSSARELQNLLHTLTGTILPTMTPRTWMCIVIGTPWVQGDPLDYLASTGRFRTMTTPIARNDDGLPAWPGTPVWPEWYNEEYIEQVRSLSGPVEFARMYLCDAKAAMGKTLRREWLHEFPQEKISENWPLYLAVDYASVEEMQRAKGRDYFAAAWVRCIPSGGVVVVDGVREHVTQADAEFRIAALWRALNPIQIGLEAVGAGQEFWKYMLRVSAVPVFPLKPGNKSKAWRFETDMAPLFAAGRVFVSDANTPFLNVFRQEWVQWPDGTHDDTLDAVYYALLLARAALFKPATEEVLNVASYRRRSPFSRSA